MARLLVFLHIPKAAGTTLTRLLQYHYPGGGWHEGGNAFRRFERIEETLQAAFATPEVRAVSGHFTVGLLGDLPSDAALLTILRDPVERTLSHYHYLVNPPSGRQGRDGAGLIPPWLGPPAPGLTLAESFAERGYIPDNLQTRMLCGIASPYDPLLADALEQAKSNLRERFSYVGTAERLDELMALLNLEYGWPTVAYGAAKAHPERPRAANLSPDDRRLVEEWNALDTELHAYARELLDAALARAPEELPRELEILRLAAERLAEPRPRESRARSGPVEARVELAMREAELAKALRAKARLTKRIDQLKERLPEG